MIDESDTNHDGVIDFQEFLDMVRRQEIHQTNEPDIGLEAFKVFDVDGDGFITAGKLCQEPAAFSDFQALPATFSRYIGPTTIFAILRICFPSADELRQIMAKLGETLTDEEVEMMIEEADSDGDGQISYKE